MQQNWSKQKLTLISFLSRISNWKAPEDDGVHYCIKWLIKSRNI